MRIDTHCTIVIETPGLDPRCGVVFPVAVYGLSFIGIDKR